jgi:Flp pilus assembly pilin Flp
MSSRDTNAPRARADPLDGTSSPTSTGPTAAADRGASAIEYALLLGLIAIVLFAVLMLLGVNVAEFYSSVATGY